MSHHRFRFFVTILFFSLANFANACMWDYDTLKQERARFPSALELITGKFLHHSREFYEWRIADRLKKLEKDPQNLGYFDDLGVAYSKIGEHQKAIDTMLAKEAIKPGEYETYANLGTFYFHAGDFEKGLPYIDKALAINPDAHFGREKYQKWLVEYVLVKQKKEKGALPLYDFGVAHPDAPEMTDIEICAHSDFYQFVLNREIGGENKSESEQRKKEKAIKGILGMMRFGNSDSPLLLEALAHLLAPEYMPFDDAKQLAARCYLKASYLVHDPHAKERYRWLAKETVHLQSAAPDFLYTTSLRVVESDFRKELSDANKWQAELITKEIKWIREGKYVETEFDKLYMSEPETIDTSPGKLLLWLWWFDAFALPVRIVSVFVALACLAVVIKLVRIRQQKKRDAFKLATFNVAMTDTPISSASSRTPPQP